MFDIFCYDKKTMFALEVTMENIELIAAQVNEVLEQLRPYLQRDGGDVEYVGFQDGIVQVRLLGACVGCGVSDVTLYQGIETALVEEVPGVIGIEDVTEHERAAELDRYYFDLAEEIKKLNDESKDE